MLIRFASSARKHSVGRASARYVMATVIPAAVTARQGDAAWQYIGPDERGRELEVVAVGITDSRTGDPCLLVIHVMPTSLRRRRRGD